MKKTVFLFVSITFLLFANSCSKEQSGSVVFYLDRSGSESLQNDGINGYSISMLTADDILNQSSGEFIGYKQTSVYTSIPPDCNDSNFLNYTATWDSKAPSVLVMFSVTYSANNKQTITVEIEKNSCTKFRL